MKVHCPLCAATDVDYEFVAYRTVYSLCRSCGLLFATPPQFDVTTPALLDAAAESAIAALAGVARSYVGRPGRALIIAPVANRSVGAIPVRTVSELEEGETYDTILVFASIERDEDPLAMLASLEKYLTADGCLVLMTPSTASPLAKSQRTNWFALRSRARYYFSPDSLQLLASRCGYSDFVSIGDARDLATKPSETLATWFKSNSALICRPARDPGVPGLLSVLFPVFNEKATVEESLQRVLNKQIPGVEIEVVIVESNSTDGSREIVQRYANHPRVNLILEDRPRGKGFAVRTALSNARGEVVLFQDADLEYDVDDYDVLVAPLFELKRNFILGSRHNSRGEAWKIRHFADQRSLATVTNVAHLFLLTMFNRLYKQRLRDPFTMYKVFRRECLYGLTFECNRFDFDYEICIKLLRKGYQPIEIPINYISRSFSEGKKVSFFGDPPTWIRAMLKLRRATLYPKLNT